MTIAANDRQVTYEPVVSTDTFAVDFPIFDNNHLRVFLDGVETAAFSVTATYDNGRSIDAEVVLTTPVSGVTVLIRGQIAVSRDDDYSGGTPNLARNLQNDMDFLTAVAQELVRDYNAFGLNVVPDDVQVSTFMETVLDDANGDAALATLGGTPNGIAILKAANYAAMRSALSLGSLALLNSVALANITAGDRPDNDDFSTDGDKLALRKNVRAFVGNVAIFRDEKASGTDGGTFTSGAWQTRTLNTTVFNGISGASLASDQVTLPAGTYEIEASAPARQVNHNQLRLYNVTDAATAIVGTSEISESGGTIATPRSFVTGIITIASTKAFRLEHRAASTFATSGFGAANAFGEVEVYATIKIKKIA